MIGHTSSAKKRSPQLTARLPDDPTARHAIARCIVGDVSASSSLDQIRTRLDHCRQYHSVCRLLNVDSAPKPLRFLDVNSARSEGEVCLVDADPKIPEPYITLSYVWGKDQTAKT